MNRFLDRPLTRRAVSAAALASTLLLTACPVTPTKPIPAPPDELPKDGAYRYDFGGEIGTI